jgi:hypothetical protein
MTQSSPLAFTADRSRQQVNESDRSTGSDFDPNGDRMLTWTYRARENICCC